MSTLREAISTTDAVLLLDSALTLTVEYPVRYVIDSEVIYVRGGNGTDAVSVSRGGDSSTIASHAKGAALTFTPDTAGGGGGSISATDGTTTVSPATSLRLPAGTLADLGSGAGGVGLLTTLMGPYHVDYTDANVNSDIIVVGPALPDHSFIIAIWALFPIGWKTDNNSDADFKLELASYPSPYSSVLLKEYNASGTGSFSTIEPVPIFNGTHTHTVPSGTDALGGVTDGTATPFRLPVGIVDYAEWSAAAGSPDVTAIQLACEVYANSGTGFTQGQADIYAIIATPAA